MAVAEELARFCHSFLLRVPIHPLWRRNAIAMAGQVTCGQGVRINGAMFGFEQYGSSQVVDISMFRVGIPIARLVPDNQLTASG